SAYDPTAMKKKKKTLVKPVSTLTVPLERYQ
nr:3B [Tortoise rafivirus A]